MGDKADGNIENVDEMFESFVKKKLQQLGMKRAAAKSTDGGTMNDLELSIKMRLEKNMAQHSNKEPVVSDETVAENTIDEKTENDKKEGQNCDLEFENGDDDDDDGGPPKPKKSKKEKKKKKKKKEKDTWEEKPDPPPEKESKSKKDKSHHKKEYSKSKKKEKKSEKDSKNSEAKDKYHNKERHSKRLGERDLEARDKTHNRDRHTKKEVKVSKESVKSEYNNDVSLVKTFPEQETATLDIVKSESTPPVIALTENDLYESLKNKKSSKITRDVPESTTPTTSGPKKDIATIKMKIELLKAKSEGEKLQQEVDGLLRKAAQNHTSTVEEKQKFGRNSESKDADGKERKRRESSRSNSHRYSQSHSRYRSRSRSRSRERKRSSLLRRSRSPPKHNRRRSRSRSRDRHRSKRSRRHSRSPLISTEDKVRLLEIAKANALAQHRAGYAANLVSSLGQIVKEGSLSVRELTTLCEDIVTGKDEELPPGEPLTKESAEKMIKEAEASKIHHPFAVRDTPITFKLNQIKSVAIPPPLTKPLQILSKEFPVSCGQQHHRKEVMESVYGKWQVVAKDEATKKAVKELVTSEKVFTEPEPVNVSLSSAIADRISAVRQLQDNPTNQTAKEKMDAAQKALDSWTKSQKVPGQFTGHTGLTAMPRSVLSGGKQAWFKADDLRNAKHVTGIGKSLLQKMGWTPGQPLGKSMPGQLEPLQLDFKTDRRGLVSFMESPAAFIAKNAKSGPGPGGPIAKDLSNKHPVSALMEICSKRHWAPPDFRLSDPLNLKMFTFRVFVCNDEYIGKPASNKKQAKLLAAQVALQNMGLIPKT